MCYAQHKWLSGYDQELHLMCVWEGDLYNLDLLVDDVQNVLSCCGVSIFISPNSLSPALRDDSR